LCEMPFKNVLVIRRARFIARRFESL